MEIASELLPIILYMLLSILVVVVIVFFYKLCITLDKTNILIDDVYSKVKKLDNLFEIIDKSSETISTVTDRISGFFINSILKIFKRKGKDDENE